MLTEEERKYRREYYHKKAKFRYSSKCVICDKGFTSWKRSQKFCSNSCAHFKGGKLKDKWGYILIYSPYHPHGVYVPEHRLIMEKNLNRFLDTKEIIHHKNGIKTDNRFENLEILTSSEHAREHRLGHKDSYSSRFKGTKKT